MTNIKYDIIGIRESFRVNRGLCRVLDISMDISIKKNEKMKYTFSIFHTNHGIKAPQYAIKTPIWKNVLAMSFFRSLSISILCILKIDGVNIMLTIFLECF